MSNEDFKPHHYVGERIPLKDEHGATYSVVLNNDSLVELAFQLEDLVTQGNKLHSEFSQVSKLVFDYFDFFIAQAKEQAAIDSIVQHCLTGK